MRRRVFQVHLVLGGIGGLLILVWAASGSLMTLEPLLLRHLDPTFPRLDPPPIAARDFPVAPAGLPVPTAAALALRSYGGRSWYEITGGDGTVSAFDARTGKPCSALLSTKVILDHLREKLALSPWRAERATRLEHHTDVYRKGRLPVYEITFLGPEGVIAFIHARDGKLERLSTRYSRATRWLGLGLHTWNLQFLMRHHDELRSLSLVGFVALPLISLSLLSYLLLYWRLSRRSTLPHS